MNRIFLSLLGCLFTAVLLPFGPNLVQAQNGISEPGELRHLDAPIMEIQDGNGTLGPVFNQTKCGLNYVQKSKKVTTRHAAGAPGTGVPVTFEISGLPQCKKIEQAYVWYVVSYTGNSPQSPTVKVTNPEGLTKTYNKVTMAGQHVSKCWGETGTRTFRVDVTDVISGNGTYTVNTNHTTYEIDGMTLFIIYSDPNAAYQGNLIIHDGLITVGSLATYSNRTIQGFTACANSSAGRGFVINSDFQLASHRSTINGLEFTFVDSFYNYDVMDVNVTAGQTSAAFGCGPLATDCYSWLVAGLYFQTTSCTTCPLAMEIKSDVGHTDCGKNNGWAKANPGPADLGPFTYEWNTTPVQTTQTVGNLAPGTYTVTVKDASGCRSKTGTVTINASTGPDVRVTFKDTAICLGQKVKLLATGGSPLKWFPPQGLDNPTDPSPTATVQGNITYYVSLTQGACTDTDSVVIRALTRPKANFDYTKEGQSVQFTGTNANGVYRWLWDFGDRSTPDTSRSPLHVYVQQDSFLVTLKVWNQCGVDTLRFWIKVDGSNGGGTTDLQDQPYSRTATYFGLVPNPFKQELWLIPATETAGPFTLTIQENTGRSIRKGTFYASPERAPINASEVIESLPAGIYTGLIQISGHIQAVKLVKE